MRFLPTLIGVAMLTAATSVAFAQNSATPALVVEQPYAFATPTGAQTGAAYMTIDNKAASADRLTGASSDIADKLQIYEMAVVSGVMDMRELAAGFPIPARGKVELKPGSFHVMLIGLKKPLTSGQTFPLTLTFEKAGNISVTVPVKAMGAMQDSDHGGMGMMHDHDGMGSMEMK